MFELVAAAVPYVPPSPTASLVSVVAWLGPLLLVLGALTWAFPLVARMLSARVNAPRGKWDAYFNGDRVTDVTEGGNDSKEPVEATVARQADLPVGVDASIFDE